MSTRSTIWYQDGPEKLDLHLYSEMMEDGQLFLEIVNGPFVCTFQLPHELIEALQKIDISSLPTEETVQ